MLQGFISNFKGDFLVDSVAINRDNLHQYRPLVGMVEQKFVILPLSLAENVAFGCIDNEIDTDRVDQALKKEQLWVFCQSLPNKIWTQVGDNGILLSGGQQQRLAMARALYRPIDILVLDEASSALDNATEQELFQTIHNMGGDLTIIMIAHRLSTLKNCDIIYFMENGQISDTGTFQQLYDKNDMFRHYCTSSDLGIVNQ